MAETVWLSIPTAEVGRWANGFRRIVERIDHSRSRRIRLSRSLRCMTGCWRKDIQYARYYGSVPRQSLHIVGIDDTIFLIAELYDWAAYPISHDDLRCIATNLA